MHCVCAGPPRSTSVDLDGQVGIVVDIHPEVYELFVWFYTWPAASTLNMAVDSGIPFVSEHIS